MTIIMTMGLVALLCVSGAPDAEAMNGWSCSVSPSFAFNGDNVTLTVTGIPGNYAFIKIILVNETLDTQLVYLDDMGHGSVVWNVPMLAETGTYRFIVVSNGVNVTEASVSIIFDDVTYLRWRVDNVEHDNAQLREIVHSTVTELNDIKDRIFWMWAAASVACGFTVCFAIITLLYYTDEMKAKMRRWKHLEGIKGKASKTYFAYLDPPLDGWMVHTIPTLAAEAERVRRRNAKKNVEPTLIVPDENDPRGFASYPVNIGTEPPKETPEVRSDDEQNKDLKKGKGGKMKSLVRKLHWFKARPPKKGQPIEVEDISIMERRLAEMEEVEQHPDAPERSERPPSPSPVAGTTLEMPMDVIPIEAPISEPQSIEAPISEPQSVENAPNPRKTVSPRSKNGRPKKKKTDDDKEAVE